MSNQPTPKQLEALAKLQILTKQYVQIAKKAGLITSKTSPIFKTAQKIYRIGKQSEKALVLHSDAAEKLQKNKKNAKKDGQFWDTKEVDSKVDAAVETISSADWTKLEYEIKAYADAYQTIKAQKGGLCVEGVAQTHNEANFTVTAELESVLKGVNVLIDAGVISESTLEVNAEYKSKYLNLDAQLQAFVLIKANVTADIKLLDLSTLTLIKAELEATAEAEINVNVQVEGELQIIGDDLTANVEADGKAYAKAEATAEANLVISKDEVKGEYRLAALAEVGVEGSVEGSIQSEGEKLVSIKATGKAVAGVGIESAGGFEWKDGEVTVHVDLGLAVEAGAGGEVEITVDYDAIADAVVKQIKDGTQHLIENSDEIYDKARAELKEQGKTLHNTYEDASNHLNVRLNDLKQKYFNFWDTKKVDSKVDTAVETISSADWTKLEYEIKAYADAYQTIKAQEGGLCVEGVAQTHNEADFTVTAELESVLKGVNVLIDAGVISESTLEVNAEYKSKYLNLDAQLQAFVLIKANVTADIKLLDLSTLTLIKAELEATAEAEINVNVQVEGELQIIGDDLTANVEAEGKAYAKAEATAEANLVISKDEVKGEYRLAALAEVGVEGSVEGSIQSEGEKLVSIKATGKAVAGVGIESAGGFEWKDGEVTVHVDLGLAVEAGAGGEVEVTVDYDAIADAVVKQIKDGTQHLIENSDEIYDKVKVELKKQGRTLHNTYEDASNSLNSTLDDLKQKYFSW